MKRTKADANQLDLDFNTLFKIPTTKEPLPGSMDFGIELRHIISDTLKRCKRDRYSVAGEMSRLVGREITKNMLDAWSAESRSEWRFPVEYAPAFELVTESYSITEFLSRKRGCKVYAGDDLLAAELGKLETLKNEINQKIKVLKQHMK